MLSYLVLVVTRRFNLCSQNTDLVVYSIWIRCCRAVFLHEDHSFPIGVSGIIVGVSGIIVGACGIIVGVCRIRSSALNTMPLFDRFSSHCQSTLY